MNEKEKNNTEKEMSGHSYDGITEFDNPMPDWWLWTFLLSIMFAAIYFLHYESGTGATLNEELAAAMAEIETQKNAHEPRLLETEETLNEKLKDPSLADLGRAVYSSKCAVCHGNELQGQIGPNLVDNYWLHGRATPLDIVKTIRQGVPEKGMPAWEQMIPTQEVYAVTAFVLSKKGYQISNAKAPQGELIQ